jgi:hypothetical protein
MSFYSMLSHKCDVYHIVKTEESPGFGLPGSPVFSYDDEPDIKNITCQFGVKGGTRTVKQNEPNAVFESRIKLAYMIGVDIRLNDKIVNLENGVEYTAELPVKIRNHHMYVMLRRTSEQELL